MNGTTNLNGVSHNLELEQPFKAPTIPVTPSARLNNLLDAYCNKPQKHVVKYGLAVAVCLLVTAINVVYGWINTKGGLNHQFWMASSAVVGVAFTLATLVTYLLVVTILDLFLTSLLFWMALVLATAGSALCGLTALVFEKPAPALYAPVSEAEKVEEKQE